MKILNKSDLHKEFIVSGLHHVHSLPLEVDEVCVLLKIFQKCELNGNEVFSHFFPFNFRSMNAKVLHII